MQATDSLHLRVSARPEPLLLHPRRPPRLSRAKPHGLGLGYANSLSAANKLLIRCAWAGTPAFASASAGYGSSWANLGSCA